MTDGMTLKEAIANEKRKWKEMDGKQKLSYYKTYYLLPSVIVLIVVIFLINLVLDLTVRQREDILGIMTINMVVDETSTLSLSDDLFDYFEGDPKKEKVSVDAQYYSEGSTDSTTPVVVQAKLSAGAIDFMLVDDKAFEAFGYMGGFSNLSETMPKDLYQKYEDKLVYLEYSDEGFSGTYPAAIDISDSPMADKYYSGHGKVYLIATVNGLNVDKLEKLLAFIYSES